MRHKATGAGARSLDPMVSAWFKDAAQETTLIELVGKRAEL
jgi:hypothetical protein